MSDVVNFIKEDSDEQSIHHIDRLPAWQCFLLIAALSAMLWAGIHLAFVVLFG